MKTEVIVIRKELSDDELMHGKYKYVKREWKNGRWHYTYDSYTTDKSGNTIKKTYDLGNKKRADKWEESIAEAKQSVQDGKERVAQNAKEREMKQQRSDRAKAIEREKEVLEKNKTATKLKNKANKTVKAAKKSIKKGQKFLKKLFN